jgi:hypothetical protein
LGGGGNDAVKNTNTNEIQILFAGYQKPAKLGRLTINADVHTLPSYLGPWG